MIIPGVIASNILSFNSAVVVPPEPVAPDAPLGSSNSRYGVGVVTISATPHAGETIDWYENATGGEILLENSEDLSTGVEISTTYYAEARDLTTGLVSLTRTAVIATVNAISAPSGACGQSECGAGSTNISVDEPDTGLTIDWYAATSGGTVLENGEGTSNFTTPNISETTTYYAQTRVIDTGVISSSRTGVVATVFVVPDVPFSNGDISEPEQDPVQKITASATPLDNCTVVWYDAATDGNEVDDPSLNEAGTITYYAESANTISGCRSLTRTAVKLTIVASIDAPAPTGISITPYGKTDCPAPDDIDIHSVCTLYDPLSNVVIAADAVGDNPVYTHFKYFAFKTGANDCSYISNEIAVQVGDSTTSFNITFPVRVYWDTLEIGQVQGGGSYTRSLQITSNASPQNKTLADFAEAPTGFSSRYTSHDLISANSIGTNPTNLYYRVFGMSDNYGKRTIVSDEIVVPIGDLTAQISFGCGLNGDAYDHIYVARGVETGVYPDNTIFNTSEIPKNIKGNSGWNIGTYNYPSAVSEIIQIRGGDSVGDNPENYFYRVFSFKIIDEVLYRSIVSSEIETEEGDSTKELILVCGGLSNFDFIVVYRGSETDIYGDRLIDSIAVGSIPSDIFGAFEEAELSYDDMLTVPILQVQP